MKTGKLESKNLIQQKSHPPNYFPIFTNSDTGEIYSNQVDPNRDGKVKVSISDAPEVLSSKVSKSITSDSTSIFLVNDQDSPGNLKYFGTNETGQKGFHSLSLFESNKVKVTSGDSAGFLSEKVSRSLTSDSTSIFLVNDQASPGNSKYYGTDASGVKGYYSLADADNFTVKASSGDTAPGFLDSKVQNSIQVSSNKLQLVGDSESPGNSKYYGTDESGNKGFHDFSVVGSFKVKVTQDDSEGFLSEKVSRSLTSDSTSIFLVGDEVSPGNSKYYGTNASGTKGYHDIPQTDNFTVKASSSDSTPDFLDAKVQNSIQVSSNKLQLVGDSSSPGSTKYYGTDENGTRGFYQFPELDNFTVKVTQNDSPQYLSDKVSRSLTSDSTSIFLVGDSQNPGNLKYYGTDESGQKGYHDIVSTETYQIKVTQNDAPDFISQKVSKSITSDSTSIFLVGDEVSPGNSKYYGTNASGTKGYHDIPQTDTYTVKASSSDSTPDFLDAKVQNSIQVSSNKLQLVGDSSSPGNSKYYGTNASGQRGFYSLNFEPADPLIQQHIHDTTSNPHQITKVTIGLGNVTNDEQVKRSEMGVANGVATLDNTGKVPNSQVPPLAISDVYVLDSTSEMLDTTAQVGDVAIITSENKTYILKDEPASDFDNWKEILTQSAPVLSVNSKIGNVVLTYSDVGAAPESKGVTNGDSHDHYGGDGAQIDHAHLLNIGTTTHEQIDLHISDTTSNPHNVTAVQVGNTIAQWNANKIQGIDVSSTSPTNDQVLTYSQTENKWIPADVGATDTYKVKISASDEPDYIGLKVRTSIASDSTSIFLVGDEETPGTLKYYGTDSDGNKGFHTIPESDTYQVKVTTNDEPDFISSKLSKSITSDSTSIFLVGDSTSPGNSKYYGTNESGQKGFYDIPTTDNFTVKASSGDSTPGFLDAKVQNSIQVSSNKLQLVGDSTSPGNSKYYGTNASGTKGFYDLPTSDNFTVKASSSDSTPGFLDAKVQNSIQVSSNKLQLVGDSTSPGNSKYYGTNESGTKGFYDIPISDTYKVKISSSDEYPDYLTQKIGGSLAIIADKVQFVNDMQSPGINRYYGTDAYGVKGYHEFEKANSYKTKISLYDEPDYLITKVRNSLAADTTSIFLVNDLDSPEEGKYYGFDSHNIRGFNYVESIQHEVYQEHEFSVLTPVFYNSGVSTWAKASALSQESLATHIVSKVIDSTTFVVCQVGRIKVPNHGLQVGEYYFTSDTVGELSSSEGTYYSNPILYVENENYVHVLPYRPGNSESTSAQLSFKNINVRHTVMDGKKNSDGYADFLTGIGTSTLTVLGSEVPLICTWANGFDIQHGNIDYAYRFNSDVGISELTPNAINYIFTDYNDGEPQWGATPFEPYYGHTEPKGISQGIALNHFDSTSLLDCQVDSYGNEWAFTAGCTLSTETGLNNTNCIQVPSSNYVALNENADFDYYKWTVEGFFKFNNVTGTTRRIFIIGKNVYSFFLETYNSRIRYYLGSTGSSWNIANASNGSIDLSNNTWYHIALVFDGSTYRGFINGVQDWSVSSTTSIYPVGNAIYFMSDPDKQLPHAGYVDEIRVTKGIARYVDAFSVPTQNFTEEDLYYFSISEMKMKKGKKDNYIDKNVLFVGQCDVGAANITSLSPYAFNGTYDSSEFKVTNNSSYFLTHNIGTPLLNVDGYIKSGHMYRKINNINGYYSSAWYNYGDMIFYNNINMRLYTANTNLDPYQGASWVYSSGTNNAIARVIVKRGW